VNCGTIHAAGNITINVMKTDKPATISGGNAARVRRIQ
jgi:hypothetical protein